MVQLSNPARMDLKLSLGKIESGQEDINGLISEEFVAKKTIAASNWIRTQNQQISIQGTTLEDTRVFLVHHRNDWDDANYTHLKFKNKILKIVTVSPEVNDLPTSYDLVTVKEVEKNG